jgi:hypothetical protein
MLTVERQINPASFTPDIVIYREGQEIWRVGSDFFYFHITMSKAYDRLHFVDRLIKDNPDVFSEDDTIALLVLLNQFNSIS